MIDTDPDILDSLGMVLMGFIWLNIVLVLGVNVLMGGRFLDPEVSTLLSIVGCVTGMAFFSR